jgi:dolichol-phosphate mannosyltransferase
VSTHLSVVMPVYNEEAILEELVHELEREVVEALEGVEVIVVDDCSTDGTPEILARLADRREWLRVERFDANRGHGPSVVHGLDLARGDWLFQLDSDGQFSVADFWKLWEHRSSADLVLGVRIRRRDPRHRLLLSRAVRLVASALAGRPVVDANSPFRLVRRSLWADLRPRIGTATLAPSIFIVVGTLVCNHRLVEVPVGHRSRAHGTSSLRALRLLRFSLRGLAQLLRFRLALTHATAPPEPVLPGRD